MYFVWQTDEVDSEQSTKGDLKVNKVVLSSPLQIGQSHVGWCWGITRLGLGKVVIPRAWTATRDLDLGQLGDGDNADDGVKYNPRQYLYYEIRWKYSHSVDMVISGASNMISFIFSDFSMKTFYLSSVSKMKNLNSIILSSSLTVNIIINGTAIKRWFESQLG